MAPTIDMHVYGLYAREIINSRAVPTIEVTAILNSGYRGVASVPSGSFIGKYEALELRDNDETRFDGMGMLQAVKRVHEIIHPGLRGLAADDQNHIDETLIALDGTEHRSKLGANTMLASSMAIAVACAQARNQPLYSYLNQLFSMRVKTSMNRLPIPIFNIINGGKHGAGNLNFQEFQIIPASSKSFSDGYRIGVEVYQKTKTLLDFRNAPHAVGDEGGFTPNLFTNMDAVQILVDAIKASPYQFGVDVFLGLDLAASAFKTDKGYLIKDRANPYTTKEFIQYLKDLHSKNRILILEDPLDADEWGGWQELTHEMGRDTLIAGDDLLDASKTRLERAIQEKSCSAILVKPNKIGTVTETLDLIHLAKSHDIKCIIAHRSGETNDTFNADLAVGVQADYVKFGAPARGERIAKYNRLLEIASQLRK